MVRLCHTSLNHIISYIVICLHERGEVRKVRFGKTLEIWRIKELSPDMEKLSLKPMFGVRTTIGEGLLCPCGQWLPICDSCGAKLYDYISDEVWMENIDKTYNATEDETEEAFEKRYQRTMMSCIWECDQCEG